jgi:hypothetical protein
MEVKEAKQERRVLEDAIRGLLTEYSRKTGMRVTSIVVEDAEALYGRKTEMRRPSLSVRDERAFDGEIWYMKVVAEVTL